MIIDAYCHLFPKRYLEELTKLDSLSRMGSRLLGATRLFDLDERFREMDQIADDYRQIVSVSHPALEEVATPERGAELAQIANDGLAELCNRHPDRFHAFVAAITMTNVDHAIREIDRSVNELGARGVQIYTNVNGAPIDSGEYEEIFARMAKYGLPIWMHPARTFDRADYRTETISRYEMWWCLGWPYETSVAMARLVFSGLFDRYPDLKIVTHHLGGMIPYFDGRLGAGMEFMGTRTPGDDCSKVLSSLKLPHMEYFKKFYADTAMFGSGTALPTGLDFFGPKNVVFATDTPFAKVLPMVEALGRMELSDDDRADILYRNAERLVSKPVG